MNYSNTVLALDFDGTLAPFNLYDAVNKDAPNLVSNRKSYESLQHEADHLSYETRRELRKLFKAQRGLSRPKRKALQKTLRAFEKYGAKIQILTANPYIGAVRFWLEENGLGRFIEEVKTVGLDRKISSPAQRKAEVLSQAEDTLEGFSSVNVFFADDSPANVDAVNSLPRKEGVRRTVVHVGERGLRVKDLNKFKKNLKRRIRNEEKSAKADAKRRKIEEKETQANLQPSVKPSQNHQVSQQQSSGADREPIHISHKEAEEQLRKQAPAAPPLEEGQAARRPQEVKPPKAPVISLKEWQNQQQKPTKAPVISLEEWQNQQQKPTNDPRKFAGFQRPGIQRIKRGNNAVTPGNQQKTQKQRTKPRLRR